MSSLTMGVDREYDANKNLEAKINYKGRRDK